MTLILGVISLLQILIFPGYLLVSALLQLRGGLRTLILTVSLSLLVNHAIVYLLTAVHGYNRFSLAVVLAVEVAALLLLRSRFPGRSFTGELADDLQRFTSGWRELSTGPAWLLLLRRGALLLALVTLACFAYWFVCGFGTIFNQWDDVVSWNRWAVDWYNGRFPTFTWHYPQLLPSVWSITYKAIGTSDIQFFAKGLMGLFPLLLLLALFDLWLRTKAAGFLAGIPITAFLLLFANGVHMVGSGYADVPVAFMAFVPLYLLLTTADETVRLEWVLFTGSLVSAGAALTKQAGLFVLLLYPFVSWYQCRLKEKPFRVSVVRIFSHFLIAVALILPWYVSTEYSIRTGVQKSEITLVTNDIHQGRDLLQRVVYLQHKVARLVESSPRLERITSFLGAAIIDGVTVTYIILLAIIVLALSSIREPLWRVPALAIMLPFTGVWVLFYSYDFRNLSVALPYIGAGAGLSLLRYGETAARRLPSSRPFGAVMTLLMVMLAGSATIMDRDYLTARQLRLQREVGNPEASRLIYTLTAGGKPVLIITNYQPVQYLPGLEKKYLLDGFADAERTAAYINNPAADYILIFQSELAPTAAVKSLFVDQEKAGRIVQLPEPVSGYSLYRLHKQ